MLYRRQKSPHKEAIIRRFFGLLALYSAFLLGCALFLQYGLGLQPCPLCILDRMVIFALFVIYVIAAMRSQSNTAVYYCIFGLIFTLLGICITARHLWLLHLPPELVPDCSPGFDYLMKNFPWNEAFIIMFKSSGECAGQHDTFAGISLPGWTLFGFAFYFLANLYGIFIHKKKGSIATPR